MIGYRFLSPAEDEMIEAAVFYEAAPRMGWEMTSLMMSSKRLIDCVNIPWLARQSLLV